MGSESGEMTTKEAVEAYGRKCEEVIKLEGKLATAQLKREDDRLLNLKLAIMREEVEARCARLVEALEKLNTLTDHEGLGHIQQIIETALEKGE